MVVVEARVLGKRKALVPSWSVPIPPRHGDDGDGGLTLRQLIERIVRVEVAKFQERQEARRFVRALTERQIQEAAKTGKVDMGGNALDQTVDVEAAIGNALQAFEDGMYLVLLDGEEQRDLDRQVYVNDESRLVFLRLTFLAGA